jgi:hypothetical protein
MPAASSAGEPAAPGVSISVRTGGRRRAASPSSRVAVRHPAGVIRSPVCAAYAIVVPWWRPKPQRRLPSTPSRRSPRMSTVGPEVPGEPPVHAGPAGAVRAADVRPRVRARHPAAKAVAVARHGMSPRYRLLGCGQRASAAVRRGTGRPVTG